MRSPVHFPKNVRVPTLLCVLIAALLAALPTWANGNGVTVYLGPLPNVTNWGPESAKGEAYVNIGEGLVKLGVTGMKPLTGERYQAWLATPNLAEMVPLFTFDVDDTGAAYVEKTDLDLTVAEYRYFVITVEPDPDPDPAPDARRALAGVLPNTQVVAPGSPSGPTPIPGATPPASLPETGAPIADRYVQGGSALGALIVAGAVISIWLMLFHRRERRGNGKEGGA